MYLKITSYNEQNNVRLMRGKYSFLMILNNLVFLSLQKKTTEFLEGVN